MFSSQMSEFNFALQLSDIEIYICVYIYICGGGRGVTNKRIIVWEGLRSSLIAAFFQTEGKPD